MAETCCLTSVSIATTKAHSSSTLSRYPRLSKPIKLSFFTSFPSWVSLKTSKFSPFNITPLVAQTSYWGQQVEAVAETEEVVGEESFGDEGEESYPEPSEDAKLFVGNLPYDADSETLAQLFNQAGVVEIAEVVYNRETDRSRGFGFVTMSTVEEAEQAVEKFHQYDLSGRLLTVNKAAPRGSRPERPQVSELSLRIYVGNLPWEVDDARLEQVFSEHGKVVDARVVIDRETGRSRGFGFVTMANETELNDAIAALDGQSLEGRAIRVNVAEDGVASEHEAAIHNPSHRRCWNHSYFPLLDVFCLLVPIINVKIGFGS